MTMGAERRKNYFIDKSFQTKFILKFCSLNIFASFLIGVLIYLLNQQTKTVAFENLELVVKSTSDFILPILLGVLVIVSLLVGVAAIVVILVTSHKISGPLYHMTLDLQKIQSGDLSSPIHIRTHDQLQKVAAEFERMRVAFQGSILSLRKNWTAIRLDEGQKKRFENEIQRIDTELAHFKTE